MRVKWDNTTKKLPIATGIIAILNIAIFSMAFVAPRVALGFSIAIFIIFVILLLLGKTLQIGVTAFFEKVRERIEKIEDDSEKEKHHMENAVTVILAVFLICVFFLSVYKTWRSRLFGLLFSSMMATAVIVYSDFWEIGQNLSTFLIIVLGYLFLRLLVRFTLNPSGATKLQLK